jgi:single-strand DNA-binding protein
MNEITITGLVATTPRHVVTQEGIPITSFRLASGVRSWDEARQRWVEEFTNWYTVTSFRQLAVNVAQSFSKGDRVIVTGTLRVRDWDNGERAGTSVEIEAEAAGHDLRIGTSSFTRNVYVREDEGTGA